MLKNLRFIFSNLFLHLVAVSFYLQYKVGEIEVRQLGI